MGLHALISEAELDSYEVYKTRAEGEQRLFVRDSPGEYSHFDVKSTAIHHSVFEEKALNLLRKHLSGRIRLYWLYEQLTGEVSHSSILHLHARVGVRYEELRVLQG